MLPGHKTFDDLRSQLLFLEQWLKTKTDRHLSVHQAFVATTGNSQGASGTKGTSNNKGNCNNRSKGGRGRNNRNDNNTNTNKAASTSPSMPKSSAFWSMPIGTVACDSAISSFDTVCSSTLVPNRDTTGMNQLEGILGSHPNIICQICHAPGHSTLHCPNCYHSKSQSVLPAYATFNPVSIDERVWYPDSAATSHMTPDDGKLISKSVYSVNTAVKVGDGTVLPVAYTGTSVLLTKHKPLILNNVLHVPQLQHNLLSVRQ